MYWWDRAADLARAGETRRFGLITTNSLRQVFNRKVTERHLSAQPPLALSFVVPDHPWVDSANGADVRIAMSVGSSSSESGTLLTVLDEQVQEDGEARVNFDIRKGLIHADLTVGAKVGSAQRLVANSGICFQGMNLVGKGFRLSAQEVARLGYDVQALPEVIKPHFNARDMMQGGEHCYVIDLYGLTEQEARQQHPTLYQWLHDRVKPEREQNNRASYRDKWWIFGEPRGKLRRAWTGLAKLIVTAETAKHKVFAFQPLPFCPDHKLYAICSDDAFVLGVLSSHVHTLWALRAGGTLEDRPTWTNTTTFLPFPFPAVDTGLSSDLTARIRALAGQIDAHRKARAAAHADVTLTGLYNVLEKLRSGEELTAKERTLHDHGLVSVLKALHDDLDAAVLAAYGWADLKLPQDCDVLLERLVALNARRAAEENAGTVRWIRPALQKPASGEQAGMEMPAETGTKATTAPIAFAKRPWPTTLPEQIKAIADVLASQPAPVDIDAISAHFTSRGRWRERLPTILDTLQALGRAREARPGQWIGSGFD